LLAKAVNCLADASADRPDNSCEHCLAVNDGRYLDLIEIDAASNTSVDDVRDLRDRINFTPSSGRYKVYIVDEVHMLSTAAFNALLKTLEEPPPHAIFVLATTEVQKIPATVLSRCQRHEFRRLPVQDMTRYLTQMVKQEQFEVEPEALELIARQATGSLRDAVSLLDQLVSMGERVTLELVRQVLGLAGEAVVGQLVTALADDQIGLGLALINQALDGGSDPRQLARQTARYLRAVLLTRMGQSELPELGTDERAEFAALAERMQVEGLLRAVRAFSRASHGRAGSSLPSLPLELAFLEAADASGRSSARGPASQDRVTPDQPVPGDSGQTRRPASTGGKRPADSTDAGDSSDVQDQSLDQPDSTASSVTVPPAPPNQGDSPDGGTLDFQVLMAVWPELLAAAYRRNPRAQALLNSCKPLGVEGQALVLGFQSDLLREKMEMGPNLETVTESLQEVIGSPAGVRCVLLKDWERDQESFAAPPPMQEDGMVATALRDLGAQIVDYREEED
jgi:DNA polymerase-3 subunit gamma/tau